MCLKSRCCTISKPKRQPARILAKKSSRRRRASHNVQAYLFQDYWEDIGTIEAFYNANLALTAQPDPPFSFYDEKAPIYTRSRYLPPTKLLDSPSDRIDGRRGLYTEGMYGEALGHRHPLAHRNRLCDRECAVDGRGLLRIAGATGESLGERENSLGRGREHDDPTKRLSTKTPASAATCRSSIKTTCRRPTRKNLGFVIQNGIVVVIKNATIPDGMVI